MSEKLKERIWQARQDYREASRKLRRARHLYVAICRESIVNCESNWMLDHVGRRMVECGMYYPGCKQKQWRFAILRHIYLIERGLGWRGQWHEWTREMGFAPYTWERVVA